MPHAPEARAAVGSPPPECVDADTGRSLSDYCSLAHVKPYIGCIDDVRATRTALAARGYRSEVVVMVADKEHLEVTLNAVLALRSRGFAHYMLLMPSEADCMVTAALVPEVGCVWSDMFTHVPEVPTWFWHKVRRIWMLRWMLFARLLQLGANVLMMDTDNVMLYDFYAMAKGSMFGGFNMVLPAEPTLPGMGRLGKGGSICGRGLGGDVRGGWCWARDCTGMMAGVAVMHDSTAVPHVLVNTRY